MFTIGEVSKIAGLTIKALRPYHEKGIVEPHTIDFLVFVVHNDCGLLRTW